MDFSDITPIGYSLVEYYFRWINWKQDAFVQTGVTFTIEKLDLVGLDALWRVATTAKDEQVGEQAIKFIKDIHKSLSPSLKDHAAEHKENHVSQCMSNLRGGATELST
eukprot:TRINITY_DN10925_c0_g1_i1.p1 TRINITY_DN10925_c0_g1~~TRINITY_DN10925_c0_g1_i1.p1  ORF type:complete len:108 (+),score=24.77 TRINITY_DN10925_c0_g1_i1:85-408(+)